MFPDLRRKFLGANFSFNMLELEWKLKAIFAYKPGFWEAKWTSRLWGLHWISGRDRVLCEKKGHLHRPHDAGGNHGAFPFLFCHFVEKCSRGTVVRHSENVRCHIQPYEIMIFTQKAQIQLSVSLHIPWNPWMMDCSWQALILLLVTFIELICRILILWTVKSQECKFFRRLSV